MSPIAGFVLIMSFQLVNFVEENKLVQQYPTLFVMSIADEWQLQTVTSGLGKKVLGNQAPNGLNSVLSQCSLMSSKK